MTLFYPDRRYADATPERRVVTKVRERKRAYRRQQPATRPVFAVEATQNKKLGVVSATYVAQQSCPGSCPFLHNGCYAENGFVGGFITKRLNGYGETRPEQIAMHEALAIDRLSGAHDLRLHIVGDSITESGTRTIAAAAERYMQRGGHRVWTYTHAWRTVSCETWGRVSVLASCETPADVVEAQALGYATELTVPEYLSGKRYRDGGLDLLPCPEQTRGVSCADCRLCMDDGRLRAQGITIAIANHGGPTSRLRAAAAIAKAGGR